MLSCWTCGGSHDDKACPHRLEIEENYQTEGMPHTTGQIEDQFLLQQQPAIANEVPSASSVMVSRQDMSSNSIAAPLSPLSRAQVLTVSTPVATAPVALPQPITAFLQRRADNLERVSILVIRLSLWELVCRPAVAWGLMLAGVGMLMALHTNPFCTLVILFSGAFVYLKPTHVLRLAKKMHFTSKSFWMLCFYGIWLLPSTLEVWGQFGLFTLAVQCGSLFNWVLAVVFFLFVLASYPSLSKRRLICGENEYNSGLPSRWKSLLACLKAITCLAVILRAVLCWELQLIPVLVRSMCFLLSTLLLRTVPPSTPAHAAKVGVYKAVEKLGRELTNEVATDAVLQLALLRWLLEYWAAPTDYTGTDFGGMLKQIIEGLKTEINQSMVPSLEQLHKVLFETDLEKEAKPLVIRTQQAFVSLSPSLACTEWILVLSHLPSSISFLLIAFMQGKLAVPLLPLLGLEAWLVKRLLADLSVKPKPTHSGLEENGMWVLLWASGYGMSLCRVWENLSYAVDECLPKSLTALRVYQTSARSLRFRRGLLKLADVSIRISQEGWGFGAGWALKEAVALMKNEEGSVVKGLATDAKFICENVSQLYQEGQIGEVVRGKAAVALEYGKTGAEYLNPWSYTYFKPTNDQLLALTDSDTPANVSPVGSEADGSQAHYRVVAYGKSALQYCNPWSYSYFKGKRTTDNDTQPETHATELVPVNKDLKPLECTTNKVNELSIQTDYDSTQENKEVPLMWEGPIPDSPTLEQDSASNEKVGKDDACARAEGIQREEVSEEIVLDPESDNAYKGEDTLKDSCVHQMEVQAVDSQQQSSEACSRELESETLTCEQMLVEKTIGAVEAVGKITLEPLKESIILTSKVPTLDSNNQLPELCSTAPEHIENEHLLGETIAIEEQMITVETVLPDTLELWSEQREQNTFNDSDESRLISYMDPLAEENHKNEVCNTPSSFIKASASTTPMEVVSEDEENVLHGQKHTNIDTGLDETGKLENDNVSSTEANEQNASPSFLDDCEWVDQEAKDPESAALVPSGENVEDKSQESGKGRIIMKGLAASFNFVKKVALIPAPQTILINKLLSSRSKQDDHPPGST